MRKVRNVQRYDKLNLVKSFLLTLTGEGASYLRLDGLVCDSPKMSCSAFARNFASRGARFHAAWRSRYFPPLSPFPSTYFACNEIFDGPMTEANPRLSAKRARIYVPPCTCRTDRLIVAVIAILSIIAQSNRRSANSPR